MIDHAKINRLEKELEIILDKAAAIGAEMAADELGYDKADNEIMRGLRNTIRIKLKGLATHRYTSNFEAKATADLNNLIEELKHDDAR